MTGIGEAAATASVLGMARKLLKELLESKLSAEHQRMVQQALEVVSDGQGRLADLQARIIDLQDANQTLTEQITALNNWDERRNQYSLVKTEVGGIVLESQDKTVAHFACPRCAESDQEIQVLQPLDKYSTDGQCPRCQARFAIKSAAPVPDVSSEPWGEFP